MQTSPENINFSISFDQLLDIISHLSKDKKSVVLNLLQKENLENSIIPEQTQQMVQERLEEYKKNPDLATDWDDFEKEIENS